MKRFFVGLILIFICPFLLSASEFVSVHVGFNCVGPGIGNYIPACKKPIEVAVNYLLQSFSTTDRLDSMVCDIKEPSKYDVVVCQLTKVVDHSKDNCYFQTMAAEISIQGQTAILNSQTQFDYSCDN